MICEEKFRLLKEYDEAMHVFSAAVMELRIQAGTSSRERYEQLRHASDEARMKTEHARQKLNRHAETHGC
jgi:hypothetical protein